MEQRWSLTSVIFGKTLVHVFISYQSSVGGFQKSVQIIWLFPDFSLNVSRCFVSITEQQAFCFNNKLCTRCQKADYGKKTAEIPVFHDSNDGGGRCSRLDLQKTNKNSSYRNNSSSKTPKLTVYIQPEIHGAASKAVFVKVNLTSGRHISTSGTTRPASHFYRKVDAR